MAVLLWLPGFVSAQEQIVRLSALSFIPQDITINEGETIKWVWIDDNHNVVSGIAPTTKTGYFESIIANRNYEYELKFDRQFLNRNRTAGYRYDYYCEPHAFMGMQGSVTVLRSATNFANNLTGWQVVPENMSTAIGACSFVLNADQTSLQIDCTHNVLNPTNASLRSNALRGNGDSICDLGNGTSPISVACPIGADDVDVLFQQNLYINVASTQYPDGELRGQIHQLGGSQSIRGNVTFADGSPMSGVTISDGTRSTTSDSSGNYELSAVPNGVYFLTATRSGINVQGLFGTNPLLVNNLDIANRNFSEVSADSCGTDSDRDGVCDREEVEDGSNPLDAGSYRSGLSSPIQALWNGFIGLTNIVEIVNTGESAFSGTLELYNIAGQKVHEQGVSVSPRGQTDIILNSLPGFESNSYGIVQLVFDSSFEEIIDGRVFFYRSGSDSEFEFAFGVPFDRPLYGQSAVTFNTFQPSLDPGESANEVSQWLSVVNLDSSEAKSFTIERRGQAGDLIAEETITVAPFSRRDLEAGHVSPGPQNVGMHVIRPADITAPYIAQLYRYGANTVPGEPVSSYSFALPILARACNGQVQYAPISVGAGATNWLEVANALSAEVTVTLDIFDNSGAQVGTENFALEAYAQRHINVGALLPDGASGSARVTPSEANSIIGQSMFYFRDAVRGNIEAMYGSALREAFSSRIVGSYNLFLGMYNWLKVTNVSDTTRDFTVTVFNPSGSSKQRTVTLAPNSGVDLGLHDIDEYETSLDSFGMCSVESDSAGASFSELLRIRPSAFGGTDFAAPTAVR